MGIFLDCKLQKFSKRPLVPMLFKFRLKIQKNSKNQKIKKKKKKKKINIENQKNYGKKLKKKSSRFFQFFLFLIVILRYRKRVELSDAQASHQPPKADRVSVSSYYL